MIPTIGPTMIPTIGRTLHYRLPARWTGDERWRPAVVVNDAFPGSESPPIIRVNLTVTLDGLNDLRDGGAEQLSDIGTLSGFLLAIGSAEEGAEPGCWRWPPRA